MTEKQLKTRESVEALIDQLTLFDDTLMSKVFDKNIPATELLLRIILEQEDIQVKEVTSQEALMNPHTDGRNIKLDIVATDSTGRYFNVEVQRSKEGAHCRRARFYSSMLDARMLKEKQKFKELMDSYVIFITEKDVVGEGLGIYHIDRIIRETQKPFEDGAHIIM
jgi:predicted transposase/invertase (TIGR01784 family)